MKRTFVFRPRARADLLEQFLYLGYQATVAVAERYFLAVDQTCARLAESPLSGTPYDSGVARLDGMRRAPVSGFRAYLVFYMPRSGSIEVVRVLHGARDIEHLFAEPDDILTPAEAKLIRRGMKRIKEGRFRESAGPRVRKRKGT